jgi:hypothetical protein
MWTYDITTKKVPITLKDRDTGEMVEVFVRRSTMLLTPDKPGVFGQFRITSKNVWLKDASDPKKVTKGPKEYNVSATEFVYKTDWTGGKPVRIPSETPFKQYSKMNRTQLQEFLLKLIGEQAKMAVREFDSGKDTGETVVEKPTVIPSKSVLAALFAA